MSLVKSIADQVASYYKNGGVRPTHVHLAPGLIGILRNELGVPDGEPLHEVMGMAIHVTPAIVVNNASG